MKKMLRLLNTLILMFLVTEGWAQAVAPTHYPYDSYFNVASPKPAFAQNMDATVYEFTRVYTDLELFFIPDEKHKQTICICDAGGRPISETFDKPHKYIFRTTEKLYVVCSPALSEKPIAVKPSFFDLNSDRKVDDKDVDIMRSYILQEK